MIIIFIFIIRFILIIITITMTTIGIIIISIDIILKIGMVICITSSAEFSLLSKKNPTNFLAECGMKSNNIIWEFFLVCYFLHRTYEMIVHAIPRGLGRPMKSEKVMIRTSDTCKPANQTEATASPTLYTTDIYSTTPMNSSSNYSTETSFPELFPTNSTETVGKSEVTNILFS